MIRRLIKWIFNLEELDVIYKDEGLQIANAEEAKFVLSAVANYANHNRRVFENQLNNGILISKMELGKLIGARGMTNNILTIAQAAILEFRTPKEEENSEESN